MTAHTAATPVRSPARPGVRSWLLLAVCEAKMVIRDTAGLIVPFGLPLLILVMSASSASEAVVTGGRTALDIYVIPLVFTMVIGLIGIVNTPSFLSAYRRTGVLRRLGATPASPVMVLVAQVAVGVAQSLLGIAVAFGVAVAFFGARPPIDVPAALGALVLTVAVMFALGMVVAAVAPTPNSAVAMGLVAYLGLGALGGMFGGKESLPEGVARVGEWLPFGAAVDALSSAWAGEGVAGPHAAVLAATAVAAAVVAAVFFRWE
ncbi:ABC transporter permease [Nocardiopsis sp. RSe5-2]|uniref:ABC transporter permease n=1 Tax=Nocardiopsis endophytica TaxID=3018445 RepID=A0ABT4U6Q3_9ACTN|nr:ABC transporter permease [Nocardiopsis endophytica]MDA2812632.1 ABC transporter permease [Nocardiopsis endophytica]